MMKSYLKTYSPGSECSGRASISNLSKLSSPTARQKKFGNEKRSASVAVSRIPSLQTLNDEDLSVSVSMRTVCVKEDKTLPQNVVVKNVRALAKKRRELIQLQKTLIQQQNTYIDLYAQLRDLEMRSGVDASKSNIGEARLLSVKGWSGHDLLTLVRNDTQTPFEVVDIKGVIGPAALKELSSLLSKIPEEVLTVAADLMARRLEILEYLRTRTRTELHASDWKIKNAQFDTETKNLHKLVVDTAKNLETRVIHSLEIAKTTWRDRDLLIKKIERLQKLLSDSSNKQIMSESLDTDNQGDKQIDQNISSDKGTLNTNLIEELNKERATTESLRGVVSSATGMLRTARSRIATLERQLRDERAKLEESIRKHKEQELLRRNRETSYDVRSKKLLQVSKTGEATIDLLTRQRDALEIRVKELHEQIETLTQDYEARQTEQKSRLESLQAKMNEQKKRRSLAEKSVLDLEECLNNTQDEYNKLREFSDRLVKVNKERCTDFLPRKENEPTQAETELWKQLQVTELELERVAEELNQSRADKESLLESLSRIAKEGPQNKMADELLNREQTICKLQRDIEELKQTLKSMKETVVQKDTQLNSLRMQIGRSISYDKYDTNKEACNPDFTLDVVDLSSKVATLKRERDSLVSMAASRALMLERHQRCAELFAQMTRARRDLAAQLEGRSEGQMSHEAFINLTPSMRNSLSAVGMKAAETWDELKAERERVIDLQNIVISQNQQLERESRIRTQLEQRRAILERMFFTSVNSTQGVSDSAAANLRTSYSLDFKTLAKNHRLNTADRMQSI